MEEKYDYGVVYKLTSPSGRIYIGRTKNFNKRMNQYRNDPAETQVKLKRAIIKYGFNNFKVEILCKCSSFIDLKTREGFLIRLFDSVNTGYNSVYEDVEPVYLAGNLLKGYRPKTLKEEKEMTHRPVIKTTKSKIRYLFLNNVTEESFYGYANDFIKKYNLCSSKISMLINHKKNQYKGWIMGGYDKKYIKQKDKYHIINCFTKQILYDTVNELSKLTGIDNSSINKLVKLKIKTFKGWSKYNNLTKETYYTPEYKEIKPKKKCSEESKNKIRTKLRSKILYKFINKNSNEEFCGTIYDFSVKYDLKIDSITELIRKDSKSLFGWIVVETLNES